jgi:nucleoside-diphosphate-sugar epimerase
MGVMKTVTLQSCVCPGAHRNHPLAEDLDHILAQTRDLWEELRGQRLFITGGTGFFGTWLLESFAWANARLDLRSSAMVLTRNPDAFRRKAPHLASDSSIRFYVGDIRSFDFPEGNFSHVIHAATEASATLNEEAPLTMCDTIVLGTRRALNFARSCGARKFLLTSSGAVYGMQPSDLSHVPEEYLGGPDPANPSSAYGEGKRVAELLSVVYAKQYGLQVKIARCFAFVGPHLPLATHFAIGNFIRDGLRGAPILVKGDGTPYRSYLYAADLAIWLWTILSKGESCRPYNVGSGESLTIAETARAVAEAFASSVSVKIAKATSPGKPAEHYVPSVARVQSELGLQQHISLNEAIRRTARWYGDR